MSAEIFIPSAEQALADEVARHAVPLVDEDDRLDSLFEWIADASIVLLGEATHGTHEFYHLRAHLTRRLLEERGFHAVLVEADWPDAYRVNRFVRGQGGDEEAVEALGDFRRFPTWMWRNAVLLDFIGWMRDHNATLPLTKRVGFYGMDLYSLHASMGAVIAYLNTVDPDAARLARDRYACFDQFGEDPKAYGYATQWPEERSCRDEVVRQLMELRARANDYLARDGWVAEDEFFAAEQNARLAQNAEAYYRAMFDGRVISWNLRDAHMAETLESLRVHISRRGVKPKIAVWAHNSHLGDAGATEVSEYGELNVGQIVRQAFGEEMYAVGFTTYEGTVSAASQWDGPVERKTVRPALDGSIESVFHHAQVPRFALDLRADNDAVRALRDPRLERAIGVVYLPGSERASHYYHARLAHQFDAVVHYDHTRAVEPLERSALWHGLELPETYPTGL